MLLRFWMFSFYEGLFEMTTFSHFSEHVFVLFQSSFPLKRVS